VSPLEYRKKPAAKRTLGFSQPYSQATGTSTLLGYTTENAVGHAIRASGVSRTDIFVTTKLPWHHASCVEESIDNSLQMSGLQYFDLYLMHFPQVVAYRGMSERRSHFYPCHFVVDYSFDAAENPRDFEKVLDSPTLN